MSYHQKYLKYKNKYLDLKKTKIMKVGLLEIDYARYCGRWFGW